MVYRHNTVIEAQMVKILSKISRALAKSKKVFLRKVLELVWNLKNLVLALVSNSSQHLTVPKNLALDGPFHTED
ncbi:hypothetical protein OIU79_012354 [Salix purpurea]|uniref:Uncharacterized protein n=1 Tax=Salix purpurea TaxID=77065 RepID=A0A9Q0Q2Y5_SALPP|nr:hypothetical protein OIU79_012354 [Salix purpurea]